MSALICDTSGLVAYFDRGDRHHAAVRGTIDADAGPFVVSPFALAELAYLLATRCSTKGELAALAELARTAWDLASFASGDLAQAHAIVTRYADQGIGLTDASLVVLAERYRTEHILTLDQRHFRVLRTTNGRPFTILP